ncbi:hypothetical protein SpiGrapes_1086 [Sphaerochaeta pleomorpha str. Grapes]|uniref:Uncharacterized protein n=1 Tax=Sphaerochaeta pleomorpha (strain ATCC BAA-1885 / DSM 22778 / Grapes) TaxID=158190 RepID=G8QS48_SPHPG|nr:DUF6675 family protein [Sphaerochaeta pleomorpha]AEV28909.1 hypothetical protein SpiGrapes_1086 [Sphaerochaeta pleomorpha str. Grapes]
MQKKLLGICFFLFCLLATLTALPTLQSALPDLDEKTLQMLLEGEIISAKTLNGGTVKQLAPVGSKAYQQAFEAEAKENSFSIAAVSYIPYPDNLKDLDSNQRQLVVFNKLRALSTQVGITYISHRAGDKPKVLIEKCYYMEDDKNLNVHLADPVVTEFPLHAESYVYQKDSTFGGNRYHHIYTNSEQEIFVEIKNVSTLKVFNLITAVPKDKLAMSMATYQLDKGLLIFSLSTIDDKDPEINILGYVVDLPSAFRRRITALQQWFWEQLNAETK